MQSHTGICWQRSSLKHNLPSSGPSLDSSSHPHSYPPVAVSTDLSKLVPSVPCSHSFSPSFSPQWISSSSLALPGSSSLHPCSPLIRFSFTAHQIPVNLLLSPVFCTGLHFLLLSWLLCTPNLSHAAFT